MTIIATDTQGNESQMAYSYDALSNLLEASTSTHHIKRYYNQKAMPTQEQQGTLRLHTSYDEHTLTLPKALHFMQTNIHYGYDDYQRLASITQDQKDITLQEDSTGKRTLRHYPNKKRESIAYTPRGEIEKINTLAYGYDALQRVAHKTDLKNQHQTDYRYSPEGILQEETSPTHTQHYSYNQAGNRIEDAQVYDSMNRLIEDSTHLYSYDERGNLQAKVHKQSQEQTHYVFNLFNQLIKWKRVDRDNQLIEGYTYSYDALNRRVSKTHVTPSNTPKQTKQTTHHYLYDDENIIGILDANKVLLASIVHDTQTDTPLSITTYDNIPKAPSKAELYYHKDLTDEERLFLKKKNKQRIYYYHRDHQGSITHLTDEEGKVVESFTYDAYGTILAHTQTQPTLNPYGYTGREFEVSVAEQTGIVCDLYYYRARYYDPMQGRFISQDPIEFMAGDVNFYRYVGGDPVNYYDPSGFKKGGSNKKKTDKSSTMCNDLFEVAGERVGNAGGGVVGTAASGFCDAGTWGGCAVANPAIIAGAVYTGGEGGEWVGEQVGNVACEPINEVIDYIKGKLGFNVNGIPFVKCGEITKYKERRDAQSKEPTAMERDHIPNTGTMEKKLKNSSKYKALERKGANGKKKQSCMLKAIKADAPVIGLPKCFHKAGKTHGNNAKVERGGSLAKIRDEDIAHYESLFKGDLSVLKDNVYKGIDKEAQECLDKIDDACKEKIKKGLKEMKSKDPTTFMNKVIDNCLNPKKKKKKKR